MEFLKIALDQQDGEQTEGQPVEVEVQKLCLRLRHQRWVASGGKGKQRNNVVTNKDMVINWMRVQSGRSALFSK